MDYTGMKHRAQREPVERAPRWDRTRTARGPGACNATEPKTSCGGTPGGGNNERVAEPWMIDELSHAGPEHLDPAFVAGFDRKQGYPDPTEDLAVFEAHGLGAASAVVDIGAGTGQFALAAARLFGHVTAVDVAPAMVASLRARAEAAGLANLECVQAGFLSYTRPGQPADGVYTRNALHQLPDFWKALALHRIAGILRPGGVLRLRDLIYDFGPGEADRVFRGWLEHASADPAEGYTGADYAEHIRTEFSTFRWLLEPMLAEAGLEIVTADFEGSLYGAYTCIKSGG
jgi:ubiquinone/menaquinone biosynthesis C-methylase UbiE